MSPFSDINDFLCKHRKVWFVLLVIRILAGLAFLYTGITKAAITPFTFENGFWTGLTTCLLSWVEIVAGLLLIAGFGLLHNPGRIVAYRLAHVVLGFIFVYSGLVKITDTQIFVMAVENYRLLPDFLAPFMAVTLPWVELVAGLVLLCGFKPLASVMLINLMTAMFIIALSISYFRGLNIDCGCFNVNITDSKHSLLEALWRDFGFLTMGLWITGYLLWYKKERNSCFSFKI